MSTLKVNTVQHNTSGFSNVVQFTDGAGTENGQLCRAWANFNGTGTVAIADDFNVSSVTDNGTGDYTVNFSSSMPDANYCGQVSSEGNENNPQSGDAGVKLNGINASSFRVVTYFSGGNNTYRDLPTVMVSIFR